MGKGICRLCNKEKREVINKEVIYMKLLMNEKVKIYVKFGELYEDPILIMEDKGKKKNMTMDSGELEFSFGEFLINKTEFATKDLILIDEILEEMADPDSVEEIWEGKAKRFTLNEKYMRKLNELDPLK